MNQSARAVVPGALSFTLDLLDPGARDLAATGGKGANLALLAQAGFRVPDGFCVTTHAFRAFMSGGDAEGVYRSLDTLGADDVESVRSAGAHVRRVLSAWPMPQAVAASVREALGRRHPVTAFAVRSSATAEDLPFASFAGQQDTFLNVVGAEHLLEAVRFAWISLFTDRAVTYRIVNGFDHRDVALAVVVQRMVNAESAGILFTADPLTGHRHIASIDAGPGLGEALVSGQSSADVVRVDRRRGRVIEMRLSDKSLAIRPLAGGGTQTEPLSQEEAGRLAISEADALSLTDLGGQIEDLFGTPQDIEWALDGRGDLHVLQSRPITTLFPLPEPGPKDGALHAYVSFGHAQMMTDAMPPMARSVWRTLVPFGRPGLSENPQLAEAGGRLFLDPTPLFAIREARARLPRVLTVADALMAGALGELVGRTEFQERLVHVRPRVPAHRVAMFMAPLVARALWVVWVADPARAAADVRAWTDARVDAARAPVLAAPAGRARVVTAREVLASQMAAAVRGVVPYVVGGVLSRLLLLRLMPGDVADVEASLRGLSGNVTTEMDLVVGDLADLARQDEYVRDAIEGGQLLEVGLAGPEFRAAWSEFLAAFGDRGPAEIDISAPRWRHDTRFLSAVIAGRMAAPAGSHRVRQEELQREAVAATARLVASARRGSFGWLRARAVRRLVASGRGLLAVREHPKYFLVRVLGAVREAVLEEARNLVSGGRLAREEDVWFVRLGELAGVEPFPGLEVIDQRRAEFAQDQRRRPPRLFTSDGEVPEVSHRHPVPPGALAGASASAGIAEGLARVVLDPRSTVLQPGEILVAHATDPGWTPLFLNAAGIVLEVGGLMTHGSVVAREYGIPAVVGVLDATSLIRSGDRVRVDGNSGYVESVEPASIQTAP